MQENEYLLQEASAKGSITPEQEQHLEAIDSWLEDLTITLEESKEYGVWGATWRRLERRDIQERNNKYER